MVGTITVFPVLVLFQKLYVLYVKGCVEYYNSGGDLLLSLFIYSIIGTLCRMYGSSCYMRL